MKKLLIVLIALVAASCSSVRRAEAKSEIVPLTPKVTATRLLGTYCNEASNSPYIGGALWHTIDYNSKDRENWQELSVRFVSDTTGQLIAELMDDTTILETKVLKGKYVSNFYLLNLQYKADFRYIIVWFWGDSAVKIGLTDNEELVVMQESGGFAMLGPCPFFAAGGGVRETVYARKH